MKSRVLIAAIEGGAGQNTADTNLTEMIVRVVENYLIPIAGALAVLFVMYGGVLYIISMGDPEKTGKAKKTLLWAILGVILVALSFVLVKILGTVVTDNILR